MQHFFLTVGQNNFGSKIPFFWMFGEKMKIKIEMKMKIKFSGLPSVPSHSESPSSPPPRPPPPCPHPPGPPSVLVPSYEKQNSTLIHVLSCNVN